MRLYRMTRSVVGRSTRAVRVIVKNTTSAVNRKKYFFASFFYETVFIMKNNRRGREMKAIRVWTAKEIKALRNRYGETQDEFCARLASCVDALRSWEQDKVSPNGPVHLLLSRLEADLEDGTDVKTSSNQQRKRVEPQPA